MRAIVKIMDMINTQIFASDMKDFESDKFTFIAQNSSSKINITLIINIDRSTAEMLKNRITLNKNALLEIDIRDFEGKTLPKQEIELLTEKLD